MTTLNTKQDELVDEIWNPEAKRVLAYDCLSHTCKFIHKDRLIKKIDDLAGLSLECCLKTTELENYLVLFQQRKETVETIYKQRIYFYGAFEVEQSFYTHEFLILYALGAKLVINPDSIALTQAMTHSAEIIKTKVIKTHDS